MLPGSNDLINIDRNDKLSLRWATWSIQPKLIPVPVALSN